MIGVCRSRWIVAAVALGLTMLAQGQEKVPAKKPGEPQAVEVFEDWGKRCQVLESSGKELCLLFQRLRMKESDRTVLYVTFGYPPMGQGPVMVVNTPLGVALPPGIKLQVDGQGDTKPVAFNICVPDGCRASLLVEEAMLNAMRGGDRLNITFTSAQNKEIAVAISLNGFAEASDTLLP